MSCTDEKSSLLQIFPATSVVWDSWRSFYNKDQCEKGIVYLGLFLKFCQITFCVIQQPVHIFPDICFASDKPIYQRGWSCSLHNLTDFIPGEYIDFPDLIPDHSVSAFFLGELNLLQHPVCFFSCLSFAKRSLFTAMNTDKVHCSVYLTFCIFGVGGNNAWKTLICMG